MQVVQGVLRGNGNEWYQVLVLEPIGPDPRLQEGSGSERHSIIAVRLNPEPKGGSGPDEFKPTLASSRG